MLKQMGIDEKYQLENQMITNDIKNAQQKLEKQVGIEHSFFFSSRRRHTRWPRDWSSDVCSSDLRHAMQIRRHRGCVSQQLRLAAIDDLAQDPALDPIEDEHPLLRDMVDRQTRSMQTRREALRQLHRVRPHRSEERRVGEAWRSHC